MATRAPHQVTLDALLALQADARGVDLSSRKRVLTDIAGTHLSGFRGRGMEFEEHRIYEPGDDVRAIDWRVTARTGQPHIKRFREERERPVYLVTDLAPSMFFATRGVYKSVLAAEAAAVLGWAAVANRDRVGGMIAGPGGLVEVRPASGRRGLLRYCSELVKVHAAGVAASESTLQDALQHVQRLARGGAVVIVLSDFQSLPETATPLLQKIASRCELVAGMISDPFERALPSKSDLPVASALDEGQRWFLKSKKGGAVQWAERFQQRRMFWHKQLLPFGVHWLSLDTAMPLREQLWQGLGHRRQPLVAGQS
jgi:uncharacterized protein (DUF58 family)